MPADDLGWLDAVALRDLVADGEVTPAELADSASVSVEQCGDFQSVADLLDVHGRGFSRVCRWLGAAVFLEASVPLRRPSPLCFVPPNGLVMPRRDLPFMVTLPVRIPSARGSKDPVCFPRTRR